MLLYVSSSEYIDISNAKMSVPPYSSFPTDHYNNNICRWDIALFFSHFWLMNGWILWHTHYRICFGSIPQPTTMGSSYCSYFTLVRTMESLRFVKLSRRKRVTFLQSVTWWVGLKEAWPGGGSEGGFGLIRLFLLCWHKMDCCFVLSSTLVCCQPLELILGSFIYVS